MTAAANKNGRILATFERNKQVCDCSSYRVTEEADDVEVDKVHREALDGFPAPVEDGLWIEGCGPGDEVCPSDEV